MQPSDPSPAGEKSPSPVQGPRQAHAGVLSTIVLAVVALVVLGGLGTMVSYLLYYQRQGPRSISAGEGASGKRDGREMPEGAREIATVDPELEVIFAIGFSPDGKLVALGDGGQGVRLYDAATGKPAGRIGEAGRPNGGGFAFAGPDRLVAATQMAMTLWDVAGKAEVRKFSRGRGVSLTASPEAKLIASSSGGPKSGRLTLIGLEDLTPRNHTGDEDMFENLALSADGKLLASSGGKGRSIKLYRLPEMKLLHTMGEQEGGLGTKLAFSPDGKVLASAGPAELRLWSVETGERLPPLEGAQSASHCCFTPDGKLLAAYHRDDKGIRFWDVATRKERAFVPVRYVERLAIAPGGKVVAAALADRTFKILDLTDLLK